MTTPLSGRVIPLEVDMSVEVLEAFVARRLGVPVADRLFVSDRRALTCGLRLVDGRGVVAKLHASDGSSVDRLRATQRVQQHLVAAGFPCPLPIVGPEPVDGAIVTVETLLEAGRVPDPERRSDRRAMAAALAELVRLCRPLPRRSELDAERLRTPHAGPWPPPADRRLSLAPTPETAWIDDFGLRARERRTRHLQAARVIGHGDWHVEHVRLDGAEVAAVYDWDAVICAPEAFVVGCALAGFTANWVVDTPPVVPTFAQALEFIGDYEAARGGALRPHERTAALCHWLEVLAYAARIEHAREAVALPAERRYRDELADHAREVLGDA